MLYLNLSLCVTEKPEDCGYHYVITNGAISNTAFKTKEGYEAYLRRTGLNQVFKDSFFDSRTQQKIELYDLIGEYELVSFRNIEEIPEHAEVFKGLSNGRYVDCYFGDVDGIRTIFKPNPNAKDVYNPVSVEEHLIISSQN